MTKHFAFNEKAAAILLECAELLRQQEANPFRVNAYLHAAETLESWNGDVRELLEKEGLDGLIRLPAIGKGIASSIAEIAATGQLARLNRLRGSSDPEQLFQRIPGVGPGLAAAIHDDLHIDTLEALEMAAHDGRLAGVSGIGPRRAAAIASGLQMLLGRPQRRQHVFSEAPSVQVLLDVDREYRTKASAGRLQRIAPRRFNPDHEAWLPILHTDRGEWHFTALFSNTARAHDLQKISDWVVLYFYDEGHHEGQHTVVTETHGPLKGQRVVRGRESECRRLLG